jgi:hypothetical protein
VISAIDKPVTLGYSAAMVNVIVQPSEKSVGFDVICAQCKTVVIDKLPSERAAYSQAGAISELMSKHRCEGKELAA